MTYYDEIAASYNELHRDEQLRKVEYIVQRIHPKKDDWLLDIGCGSGIASEQFDCHKVGIDSSKALLKQAKDMQTHLGAAESLPFEDNKFDYIISLTAIQNFTDIEQALKEMKRVLKQEGKAVISCLKRSAKLRKIEKLIAKHFKITETIEEDRDVMWTLEKK